MRHPPPPTATVLKTVPLDAYGRYLLKGTVPHLIGVNYDFELDLIHHCVMPVSCGNSITHLPRWTTPSSRQTSITELKECRFPREYWIQGGSHVKEFVHDYNLVPIEIRNYAVKAEDQVFCDNRPHRRGNISLVLKRRSKRLMHYGLRSIGVR